jgi:hypothetical protein
LAHELGHHVHRHILKSIFVQAGITLFGFWAANFVLHLAIEQWGMFERLSDFANLPLLVLVSTILSFLLMPALNAYSRFNERQADRYAFQSIRNVRPFISSMNKLAAQNLAERTPSKWWNGFHHPAISRRVAAAGHGSPAGDGSTATNLFLLKIEAKCCHRPRRISSTRRKSSSVSTPTVSWASPHGLECHFQETAAVRAFRFVPGTIPAGQQIGQGQACGSRRSQGVVGRVRPIAIKRNCGP